MGYETELTQITGPSGKSFRVYEDASGNIQIETNGTYTTTGELIPSVRVDPVTGGRKLLVGGQSSLTLQADGANGAVMIDWADATIGSTTSGWTVVKDTSHTFAGKTSLKVTATAGASDTLTCDITIPSTFFGGAKRICFAVSPGDSYISGDGTNPVQIWLNYSASTTHRVMMYTHSNYATGEWFESGALFDQDATGSGHATGTTQWAKVASEEVTTVRLVMTKRAGQAISVPAYVGPLYTDPVITPKATLSIFMDGNYVGQWKYARQILQAYGMRASLAVVVPWVTGPNAGTMTEAQLLKMYDLGHEFICHTGTPGDFGWDSTTKYPDGQEYELVKADIQAAFDWMVARGATRGRGYAVVGFTNGLVNTQTYARRQNISNAIRDAGVIACRQLGAYIGSYYGNGGETSTVITQSRMATSGDATATLTGVVDQIIARGGWSGLTFHDIVLSGATGNNYNVADFETVMDYIAGKVAAGTLRVLPFSEAMVEMSNVVPPQ